MKKLLLTLSSIALLAGGLAVPVSAANQGNQGHHGNHGRVCQEAVGFLQNMGDTILNFDEEAEAPTREHIEMMLEAAMKAATGLNRQPLWITVVEDTEAQHELALTPEVRPQEGTVLFIYSYPTEGNPSDSDIGISYAYLHTMAEALGYGAHVYHQPARMMEEGVAQDYGVPEGYTAHSFVLVGLPDTVDVNSSATPGEREANYNYMGE